MNSIKWHSRAIKQLLRISPPDQVRIKDAAAKLSQMPHCQHVKSLTNHPCQYRLRVGHYRVFFNFDGNVRIVSIEEVHKRDDRTY
ncbi:type II toxin-antitoxin system RelE family toxin [Herbaspirillum rubrisubalbicans]|uniref:Type II toxin-antitoxin system RelE/ParE family toxin n=1 Tax=Herbaspirillum rubrisubalbicans TaxID=80842 RepID=A0AAD0XGD6_9BURK|nr:type II toxin-antitoxin system RelE/ParE family toxin [Herbaspirillum rubrisubalbicans]AYR23569.1 type II toxin-antitoxin system RelE/ParE family toxin [Herbaspirillum rubrisubalbicans]